jgi:hypothetical protein
MESCKEAESTSEPQQLAVDQMQDSPAPISLMSAIRKKRLERLGIDLQGSTLVEGSKSYIYDLLHTPGEHTQQCSAPDTRRDDRVQLVPCLQDLIYLQLA